MTANHEFWVKCWEDEVPRFVRVRLIAPATFALSGRSIGYRVPRSNQVNAARCRRP